MYFHYLRRIYCLPVTLKHIHKVVIRIVLLALLISVVIPVQVVNPMILRVVHSPPLFLSLESCFLLYPFVNLLASLQYHTIRREHRRTRLPWNTMSLMSTSSRIALAGILWRIKYSCDVSRSREISSLANRSSTLKTTD